MKEWFKKWFSSDEYLSVYSHRNEKDAQDIIRLITKTLKLKENANILDAACGAGRHSILLAEKGYNLTAFDLSRNLLKIAAENALDLGVNINFICSDLRYASFRRKFDLILNMFTSFGYFDNDDENFSFFNNSKYFLSFNGYIVLDYFNEKFLKNNLVAFNEKKINGKIIKETRSIVDTRVVKKIAIEYDGKDHIFYETVKMYKVEHLENTFTNMGFKIENLFGDYKGNVFDQNNSERLIMFLKK
ncbi:MAG: class I SAM-dependent methyltransferase [Melioribacteraceae bacterium]|nr:class I SAM-dependent methyltransferase [Melioribacteraceae bacterium]